MDNTGSKAGSVFNMAMAYLTRIDKLLTQASFYSFHGDIDSWQKILRALYREVSIKLGKEEIPLIEGEEETMMAKGDKVTYKNSTFWNLNILLNDPASYKRRKREIMAMLDIIEQKLRRKMQEKDMLLPGKNDPRFAILER